MKRTLSYVIVILLGLFLGRELRKPDEQPDLRQPNDAARVDASLLGDRGRVIDLGRQMVARVSHTERTLALADRAERLSGDDLARLVDGAGGVLKQALARRWAIVDPVGMLESLPEIGGYERWLIEILFEEWMKRDPDRLLEYLESPRHARWTNFAVWEGFESDPHQGFEIMRRFGRHHLGVPSGPIESWVPQDPRASAELLVSLPSCRTVRAGMVRVGEAWAAKAPQDALAFAEMLNPELEKILVHSAMKRWCLKDPKSALAYVEQGESSTDLRYGLVLGLGQSDPKVALDFAQEHLESKSRADAVAAVVEQVAARDRAHAAQLVADLPAGGVLNRAAETYVQLKRIHEASERDEILGWIDSLSDTVAQRRAVAAFEWNLQSVGKHGLADFVAGPYGHLALPKQVRQAAIQRARQDVPSAIAWAQGLPEDRRGIALGAVEKERKN